MYVINVFVGIEARSLNTGIYEIVDTRTGAHYLVHRTYGQEQTILTVRVSVSASSYSAGAFIDGCSRKSVLALSNDLLFISKA